MKSLLQIADCYCVCVYGQHNPGLLHSMDSARGAAPCWKLCWNLPNYLFMNLFYTPQIVTAFVYTDNITLGGLLHSMDSARGAAPCWKNVTWVVICRCWKGTWEGTWRRTHECSKIYVLKYTECHLPPDIRADRDILLPACSPLPRWFTQTSPSALFIQHHVEVRLSCCETHTLPVLRDLAGPDNDCMWVALYILTAKVTLSRLSLVSDF